MKTFLRIKLRELAAEGRANAKERKKFQKKAQRGLERAAAVGTPPKFKAWMYYSLHNHRLQRVRPEARATQLALGFLCGKKYHEIERHCYTAPKWDSVKRMVWQYNQFPVSQPGAPSCYFEKDDLEARWAQFEHDGARALKVRESRRKA